MMKSGRKPRLRKVSWFGTVKMRLAIIGSYRSGQANSSRYSFSERPTLRSNISEKEGIEPLRSSSEILSTRCIGKNSVGRPTRSPSGCNIWYTKSSKEFRSMPRSVTPAVVMDNISPQTFSRGVCRLTITIECRSKTPLLVDLKRDGFEVDDFPIRGDAQPRFRHLLHGLGRHASRDFPQHQPIGRHLDDSKLGDNQIDNGHARERQRAFAQNLGLAVLSGMLHGD